MLIMSTMTWAIQPKTNEAEHPTRVTIFGDSYSTFEGWLTPATNESWYWSENSPYRDKNNDVTRVEQTWWWQVIEHMGWQLEMNNSYSGSTVGYFGYQNMNYQPRSFNTRVQNLGEPDVILSCCITNDSWTGEQLGDYQYANWTENDMWYFRPAMARLCATLRLNYPQAKVLFILNTQLKPEFCESMRIICRHYGFPLLELHDIDKQDGHPSQKGHAAFADQVINFLTQQGW
ncbi:MAG: SGNH/GDSL hydrolase family protein [Paludibacteraceae bacterium]|nr:SGNH/GDSL hydrolase family protein [Paludibacteraceae bacterium]